MVIRRVGDESESQCQESALRSINPTLCCKGAFLANLDAESMRTQPKTYFLTFFVEEQELRTLLVIIARPKPSTPCTCFSAALSAHIRGGQDFFTDGFTDEVFFLYSSLVNAYNMRINELRAIFALDASRSLLAGVSCSIWFSPSW